MTTGPDIIDIRLPEKLVRQVDAARRDRRLGVEQLELT